MSRLEGHTNVQFCQAKKRKDPGIKKIVSVISIHQEPSGKMHHRTKIGRRIKAFFSYSPDWAFDNMVTVNVISFWIPSGLGRDLREQLLGSGNAESPTVQPLAGFSPTPSALSRASEIRQLGPGPASDVEAKKSLPALTQPLFQTPTLSHQRTQSMA